MRALIVPVTVVIAVLAAQPRPAHADLGGSIYDDVRNVVEELIESEVSSSVVTHIQERAPVVAAYFHGTLERLASPYWGSLAGSMRDDLTAVIGDFVYWMASTPGADDDVLAAAGQFFRCARGDAGPGCDRIAATVVEQGRTLLDVECRRQEPPRERRVACDLGLAVRSALEQRPETRHHLLDALADLLLGQIEDAGLARRLREVLSVWLEDPTSLPAVLTDLVAKPEVLAALTPDALATLCADKAALRAYFEDPSQAPGWACFAISAKSLPDALALDVTLGQGTHESKTTIQFWRLAEILDGVDAGTWGDDAVYSAIADAAVEGQCKGKAGAWPCDGTAATTIAVSWLDLELDAKLGSAGKYRGATPKEMARWMKRFLRVSQEVAKLRDAMPAALSDLLFVPDQGRDDAPQILGAVAMMSRLAARLQERWYLWQKDQDSLENLDIVALLDLARETVAEAGTAVATDAALLTRVAGGEAHELGDWFRLAVRGDQRELAMQALRAGLDLAKSHANQPYETFFVALAAYLLDTPDGGGDDVTRGAFRSAAKQLLLSAKKQGVPREDDRVRLRWLPRLGLRALVNDEIAVGVGAKTRRFVVAADWPTFMVALEDHVGLELSVIDPVAPLAELALREPGEYRDEKWVALDAVRPRLGVWTALPELSRRLAITAGVGARLVGVDLESAPGAPIEARYVRRTSLTVDVGVELVF